MEFSALSTSDKTSIRLKRYLIIILFPVLTVALADQGFSQNTNVPAAFRYFNKTEAAVGLGFGSFKADIDTNHIQKKLKNDQIIFSVQTINGVCISGRYGLGLGIGAEFWQKGMFYPVFVHLYYDFKDDENTPFAFLNIGKAFGTRYATYYYASGQGGFLFSIGAGYKMKVSKRLQFEYALFYRYQAIQSTYQTEFVSNGKLISSTTDYKVPYNFGGFRIAILFR
jgi:hypothetical protein